ncbi:hypothetical protein PRIPAC_95877 [Pristionchus pacificus]|uniref:Calcineurin-like phosphoesterase n=1 Tax=Pristionchus pacificus TaxID=54126 RepID=A0A2A6B2R6_PRIPA|nr:hypothetical protein PRIPAC_95877 [Pristionchus pacificus]|eukprot:PDM60168.1 Calcineurin-like phosphoesterase [Pristionchus pacificus]
MARLDRILIHLVVCAVAISGEASPLRFLVVGDIGGMPLVDVTAVQLQVARSKIGRSRGLTSIINLGDNFYFTGVMSDDDPRFRTTFENVYRDTGVPWLTIAGNHDHMGNVQVQVSYTAKSKLWLAVFVPRKQNISSMLSIARNRYFPSLYYNKVYQSGDATVEFVMLDTVELADYLFVAGHYPAYSISSQGPTQCLINRLVPLLKKYRVNAYFAGHEHNMQHLDHDGVTHIISGAGSRSDESTAYKQDMLQRGVRVYWK